MPSIQLFSSGPTMLRRAGLACMGALGALVALGLASWQPAQAPSRPILEGRIADSEGKGIAGVGIVLHGGVATRWAVAETRTDADGVYRFDPFRFGVRQEPETGPPYYLVGLQLVHEEFVAADGKSWWDLEVIDVDRLVTTHDIVVQRGGRWHGQLVDEFGNGFGQHLRLRGVGENEYFRWVATDKLGRFDERGLYPGEYICDVNSPKLGYPELGRVVVIAGEAAESRFETSRLEYDEALSRRIEPYAAAGRRDEMQGGALATAGNEILFSAPRSGLATHEAEADSEELGAWAGEMHALFSMTREEGRWGPSFGVLSGKNVDLRDPALSPDGRYLVFSRRAPEVRATRRYDLWVAERGSGRPWVHLRRLGASTAGNDRGAHFDSDGTLRFASRFESLGGVEKLIPRAAQRVDAEEREDPFPSSTISLEIARELGALNERLEPTGMSVEGYRLYIESPDAMEARVEAPETSAEAQAVPFRKKSICWVVRRRNHDFALWGSTWEGRGWSRVRELGGGVNTKAREHSPFFTQEGRGLAFTRDGEGLLRLEWLRALGR